MKVITSKPFNSKKKDPANLAIRVLHVDDGTKRFLEKIIYSYFDIKNINRAIKLYKPDIIYLWHVANLTRALFPYLADLNIPIVFDEGGVGLRRAWQSHGIWDLEGPNRIHFFKNKVKEVVIKII